jgi:hypothetical protein
MSRILSPPSNSADVEAAIVLGVNIGRFIPETRVSLFEASSIRTRMFLIFYFQDQTDSIKDWDDNLNDEGLARKLDVCYRFDFMEPFINAHFCRNLHQGHRVLRKLGLCQ